MVFKHDVINTVLNDPTLTNKQLYNLFEGKNKTSVRVYANMVRNKDNSVITKVPKSSNKLSTQTKGGSRSTSPPTTPLLIPEYKDVNIKSLLKRWSIHQLYTNSRSSGQAMQTLTKPEFIEQGEIKHGVYWTSDMPPYHRPDFLYPWQNFGIDLMLLGHCLWQAGRQLIGKTTGAGFADFEDMLIKPNTTIGLAAPGVKQCENLLRQMFKEVITLPDGSKFDLWHQLFKPYFIIDNVNKYVMKNGSMIYIIPLNEGTAPGAAIDILHIEEIDKAVDDPQKLRGLGAILPTIRARRDHAKIRITCNVKSAVYRVLREELKQFGPLYFPIYMEKPYDTRTQKFTGEHFIYNEYIEYDHKPDIDDILQVLMDTILGSGYTQAQLGNLDDFEGSMWNPDKLDKAYEKGKTYRFKEHYEHTAMGIDPGAVHAFAITIWGKEGVGRRSELVKLWSGRFTISGRTETEKQKMIKIIAKTCAKAYLEYDCEFVAYESNSGALLVVPFIGYYVKKFRDEKESKFQNSYAKWRERISNFGGDKEQGPQGKIISRADYIMLLSILIDYGMVTIPIISASDHILKLEFARYKPADKGAKDAKYKGDMVDSTLHVVWHLCGGRKFIRELTRKINRVGAYAL